jgi:fatty-acyl-CoA synthase
MKADLAPPADRRRKIDAEWSPWLPRSIFDVFATTAARFPQRPFVMRDGEELSYQQVDQKVASLASALKQAGVGPGDRVGILLSNTPEFVITKFAIARIGAAAVPLNVQLGRQELSYILAQSGARALIAMSHFRGRDYVADIASLGELPGLSTIIMVGAASAGALAFQDCLTVAPQAPQLVKPEQLSDIIYTSGTTGTPKGVQLSHDMVVRTAFASARVRALPDASRLAFVSPLYHVHGYVECLVPSLFVGGAIVLQEKFDAEGLLKLAERHAATEISGVPTMTQRLLEAARRCAFDSSSLVTVFNTGGINRPGIWPEIRQLLRPNEVLTAYGMTETTASTVCTLPEGPDECLLGTNGLPKDAGPAGADEPGRRLAEYRLADEQDGIGELQVRGPQVTSGYYDDPEATAAASSADGWLRTGDLGKMDERGYVTLVGRIKEAYRCAGEMVMPREVEQVIEQFPGVAEVFVVGVPDARLEEVGCACVVLHSGSTIDAAAMNEFCRGRLARFKVPKYVLIFSADEIPLTATGRPKKYELVKLAEARLTLAREEEVAGAR